MNEEREILHNLKFADDIVLISDSLEVANEMNEQPSMVSQRLEQQLNYFKVNLMTNLVPSEPVQAACTSRWWKNTLIWFTK